MPKFMDMNNYIVLFPILLYVYCCNCFFDYSSPKNCISFIVSFSHLIWSFIWFVFFQYKDCWQQFFLTIVWVGRKSWGRKSWGRKDKKIMIFPASLQPKFWGRKSWGQKKWGRIDWHSSKNSNRGHQRGNVEQITEFVSGKLFISGITSSFFFFSV